VHFYKTKVDYGIISFLFHVPKYVTKARCICVINSHWDELKWSSIIKKVKLNCKINKNIFNLTHIFWILEINVEPSLKISSEIQLGILKIYLL